MAVEKLIVDHIDTWTTALQTRSTAGRGSSGKIDLYGIKKLRELILELAVRGKLVPQDQNDEPASELLKRIAAEKAELVKQGKIKKPKPLPEISEEEKPFELPVGWEWTRLGFISNYGFCDKAEPEDVTSDTWILELEDIEKVTSKLLHKVTFAERPFKSSKNRFSQGDVLYGKLRPYLDKVIVANEPGVCTTEIIPITSYGNIYPEFLRLLLKAPNFIIYANSSTHGMNLPRLGTEKAQLAVVELAPIQEQLRIVSRVNKLMSLCDQLEQHSLTSLDAHQQLVETLLTTLTNSQNADELAENWARISEHFDTLFTTEASIDALKQTILQLAVMGKLVQSTDVVEYKKLKTFLSFGPRNGFSPVESKNNTRFKVLKLGATSYGELNIQESKFVDIDIDNNSHLYIKEGDILIQRGNSANFVGCNVLVKENHKNIIYPDLMMKIRTNEDLLPEYASIWLSSPLARGFMWDRMTGTSGTMPKISKKVVEEIPIIVPSIATQQKCIAFVNLATKICSDLKTRLQTSQQTQLHLADALTDAAIN